MMDVIQMVIRPVALRLAGVLAAATRLAADMKLAGEAAGVQRAQLQELVFEVKDFFINVLHGEGLFHIRYHS